METPHAEDLIHMHQRKPIYPIGDKLRAYMRQHDRELELPIAYVAIRWVATRVG